VCYILFTFALLLFLSSFFFGDLTVVRIIRAEVAHSISER
jgi:hypothetical protein